MVSALLDCAAMASDLEQSLQFLTLQQTAEVLQLSRRTLLRMLKHKTLPAVKVGAQWRIHENALAKWLDNLHER